MGASLSYGSRVIPEHTGPGEWRTRRGARIVEMRRAEALRSHLIRSLVTITALVALVASCLTGAAGSASESSHRVGTAGVSVAVPAGWHFFGAGVAPRSMPYADPLVRIVVASSGVVSFPRGCKAETFRFRRRAVGLMVVEWRHPLPGAVFPSRPHRFTAKNLPIRPRAVECWPGPGGGIEFRSKRRDFAAYLLLSPWCARCAGSQGARGSRHTCRHSPPLARGPLRNTGPGDGTADEREARKESGRPLASYG